MDFYHDREAISGCFPHDAITILAALAPDVFYSTALEIEVDCSDAKRGRTTPVLVGKKGVDVLTGGRLKWVREVMSDLLQSDREGALLF
jgi:inosine-uridine nucleoside N-ribohydrolase